MKYITRPGLSLFLIAAVATTALALVNSLTLGPIAEQQRIAQEKARIQVLPQASHFSKLDVRLSSNMVNAFEGLDENENRVGIVMQIVAPQGYSGGIDIMVGISTENSKISGMRVMRHEETPGLGALAAKEPFYRLFDNRALVPLNVVRTNPGVNDIQAITASTITTRAVTNAVNEVINWYNEGGYNR